MTEISSSPDLKIELITPEPVNSELREMIRRSADLMVDLGKYNKGRKENGILFRIELEFYSDEVRFIYDERWMERRREDIYGKRENKG